VSEQEATPSGRVGVAIPEHLRAQVRVAAEWRVVKACKNVTVPQEVGPVCDAVHTLDGFDRDELPAATLIDLGKEAIDWWMPTARPHTTEQWEALLDDLDLIRDLVTMVERLTSSATAEN
jgi:hypothetical protein